MDTKLHNEVEISSERTASIDGGHDALKGIFGGINGRKLYIPNCIYKTERDELISTSDNDPLKELHVKITSDAITNAGTYAVGTLASRFPTAEQSNVIDKKSESNQTIIMILTALAFDAVQENPNKDFQLVSYVLSTGLPIYESKVKGERAKFAKKIEEGIHQVEFIDTPKLKGKKVQIKFKKVYVNTEGHAAMVNATMDDSYQKRNEDLMKKNILIDDMGGITTDFAVIRNGAIDNELSSGLPLGVSKVLDDIIREVFSEFGHKFRTRRELVECITSKDEAYEIRPNAQKKSIKEIVDNHLKEFALEQYKELQYVWQKVGDLHAVRAVGGTAFLIKSFLLEFNEKGDKYPITFEETADESIWCIAKAYQKLLVLKAENAGIVVTR